MARPSIVPIALTVDDRTGYTLWAPPWEEDGEEWQAFLGTTEDDTARVHLFPTPAALAAFCRTSTDHDLADHPVWPVVAGLRAADLTPDEDHRFDLDGVYDIAADNPDRWAVEELAATVDIVSRLAECLDTGDEDDEDEDREDEEAPFEAVADLVSRPEVGSLGLGIEAFLGRAGEESWVRLGAALDELWEDVLEELGEHLDWTGAGTASLEDYPSAAEAEEDLDGDIDEDIDEEDLGDDDEDDAVDAEVGEAALVGGATTGAATGAVTGATAAGATAVGRVTATPQAVAAAAQFWEGVGILPVEVVVPEGAGVTLRCYVEDAARFLGRDREVYLFPSPTELARFTAGDEPHDLTEIASWPEVADTDVLALPAEQDRYDLTELAEVLAQVADGAGGLVGYRVLAQPVEGARDVAEYAGLGRVEQLLAPDQPLGRAVARCEREPDATLRAEDAAVLRPLWDEVVTAVAGALTFRD